MLKRLLYNAGDKTLTNSEERRQDDVDVEATLIQFSLSDIVLVLWRRRGLLTKVAGVGMLLAICCTFLIQSEYESTTRLMPPEDSALSSRSLLGSLMGGGMIMSDLGGGLLGGRQQGATTIAMLSSRTVEDDVVNRFGLMNVYDCKLHLQARDILENNTKISEDKKSGVITITVTDTDPNRAHDIAGAYIEELNKLVNNLSSSSARNERMFLETRLKSIKGDLDSSTQALGQFSSRNATFDPQKQGEASLETAQKLQSQLIAAQSELSGLKAVYADDNVRVREARSSVDELHRQLTKMAGSAKNEGADASGSGHALPSVRDLPLLGATYYDLYRKVTMEEALYEALTKQYEVAKVLEAQEDQSVKVIDAPDVAERRLSKHRAAYMFFGMVLFAFAGVVWIVIGEVWRITDDSHPAKALAIHVLGSMRRQRPTSSN